MEIESQEAKTQVQNPEAESIEKQIKSKFDQYIRGKPTLTSLTKTLSDIGGQGLSQEKPETEEKPIEEITMEEKPAEESPEEEKPIEMEDALKEANLEQLKESLLTKEVDDKRFKEEQSMNEELVE